MHLLARSRLAKLRSDHGSRSTPLCATRACLSDYMINQANHERP